MAISGVTREALNKLAHAIVREPDNAANFTHAPLGGFRQGPLPTHLRHAVDGGEALAIEGEEVRLYDQALARLSAEREVEHLTTRDVDDELWELVCELFVHRDQYRNDMSRARRIREFLTRVQKPWQEYEVITAIQNLRLRVKVMDIAGVRLRCLSARAARDWGLASSPRLSRLTRDLIGKTVALTVVEAGTPARAAERAGAKTDDALNALRSALTGSILANILAEQLQFRRDVGTIVKTGSTGKIELITWRRPFQPMEFEIRRHTAEPVRRYLRPVNAAVERQGSDKLSGRLLRALNWIGTGAARESHDDKIVDLCTALETLLTLRSDKRKAEAIALRSILLPQALGQPFFDPFLLYWLYELRSEIVHGSELRVCGQRQSADLLWIATKTAAQFADLIRRDSSIATHNKLIAAIERPDLLTQAIAWLEPYPGAVPRSIAKFAHARLKAAQQGSN